MNCLWCMEEMTVDRSWSNFLSLAKPTGLCDTCKLNLLMLKGSRCNKCSRETTDEICQDCQWWERSIDDPLSKNYSIFQYNSFMKEVIAKWKYRGDYILGNIFKPYFLSGFLDFSQNLSKEAVLLPIPLSQKRLAERGFNQAEVLADFIPLKQMYILSRMHGEKQSKKSRYERIYRENPFYLSEIVKKPVILVDDIYTTGTTLRHAASILKENGCPRVYAFTLIRG